VEETQTKQTKQKKNKKKKSGLLLRQALTNSTTTNSFKAPLLELNLLEHSTYSGPVLSPIAPTERENNESSYMAFAFRHKGILLKTKIQTNIWRQIMPTKQ